jgi:hypothetical protein
MWTLQIYLANTTHPMNMMYKEEAAAYLGLTTVMAGLEANGGVDMKDEFGTRMLVPKCNAITAVRLENAEKFLEANEDYSLLQQYSQVKLQKRAASDPKLKFLSGLQGSGIGRG